MRLVVCESKVNTDGTVTDIPQVDESKNTLYIPGRKGQEYRVGNYFVDIIGRTDKKFCICPIWDLGAEGFITINGVNEKLFKAFDVIYCTEPRRVPEIFRTEYERLLWKLSAL